MLARLDFDVNWIFTVDPPNSAEFWYEDRYFGLSSPHAPDFGQTH
jgi:hypothetical protein